MKKNIDFAQTIFFLQIKNRSIKKGDFQFENHLFIWDY
ncbi:hypothetical protein HJ01_02730 [Flavobacterium frigoris PS1]|uniref:Uncharacterized protein n=1 Tax=Flavobacterium frigoris (strain PS1) TaxID=1086011 RepID=H7FU10_FLAFP|nr:hypothetical protein HJ01_02730 [Flavobacterium frigoris PS1]